MIERLLSFLKELPGAQSGALAGKDDPKVAAAALMIHVMDADGVRQASEVTRLKQMLSEHYGVKGETLEALFRAGERADQEAIDLYAFTSVLKRHLDEEAKAEFIGIMWEVVFADGELHELEDNTVWRVAELIGVDRHERIAARQRAQRQAPDKAN
ncbi:hypothetical protein MesoLjLc_20840 [Mesorhizobium sp. L-8-10]|uniref:tellurite resistance TerB family protein n=1 Tax=unclassified Mesorhizobium TaxID=325217 RepID=UPI001929753C|nr:MULTISPECIES: TerB family tellurite resistance protein [unclassified Mesorhizobium]BCH22341.1 hypothetical protein MesoLjLb_21260 [Mesorhizobium sp. L-8-3]BCH30154.1 hypothetical protein MesoLjLc_20840 [Mesorhizobium sp. L-8-10]